MNENEAENSPFMKIKLDEIKKNEETQRIINETYEDLKNNLKYKEFFEQFNADSVKQFIKDYAREKGSWLRFGEMYIRKELNSANDFRERAWQGLWEIQQKKLFNLQCLWRAEKIVLPDVESIYDFMYWQDVIKTCPFLDPISEEEVDLYKLYLKSNNARIENSKWISWQNYDSFKQDYLGDNDESILPDWYEFYDNRMGTGSLFLLPDIRGIKERKYLIKGRDYEKEVRKEIYSALTLPVVPGDPRPLIDNSDLNLDSFIKEFEKDKLLLEYHRLYKNEHFKEDSYDVDVIEIVYKLDEIEEILPIKTHWNWKEAIEQVWNDFPIFMTHESMDSVYEDYLFRLNSGIPFEMNEYELREIQKGGATTKLLKQMVLEGRRLKDEPMDFNF